MTGSSYEVNDLGENTYIQWKNLILPAIVLGIRPLTVSGWFASMLAGAVFVEYIFKWSLLDPKIRLK